MGSRRKGRELAIQFLYQYESNPEKDLVRSLRQFWMMAEADEATQRATAAIAEGILKHLPDIDAKIVSLAANWEIGRIAPVDRNILRLAIYEMMYRSDIPPVVSINEAIEIAKRFSTEESGKFVNGILDKLRKDLPRPSRQSSGEGS